MSSVHRNERDDSDMQFVQTARDLQIYVLKTVRHFPKSYTFYLGLPLAESARKIHSCVKRANSINPTNQHEAQMRIDQLLYARAEIHNMIAQVEVAAEVMTEKFNKKEWMSYLYAEIPLVNGVIKSDRARYRRLP